MANNTIKVSKNTKTNSVSVNKNSAEYQKRMQELNDEEGKRAQARAQRNIESAHAFQNKLIEEGKQRQKVNNRLDPSVKLTKAEKKESRNDFQTYLDNNEKARKLHQSNNANARAMLYNQMSDREKEEYQRMSALDNKTRKSASAVAGALEQVPGYKAISKKIENALGITDDATFEKQSENAKKQSPIANILGQLGASMAEYGVANEVLGGIGAFDKVGSGIASKLNSIPALSNLSGATVGNLLRGQTADTLLDTLPNMVNDIREGKSASEVAANTAKNVGTNALFNVGSEYIPFLASSLGKYRNEGSNVADAVKDLNIEDLAKDVDTDLSADALRKIERDAKFTAENGWAFQPKEFGREKNAINKALETPSYSPKTRMEEIRKEMDDLGKQFDEITAPEEKKAISDRMLELSDEFELMKNPALQEQNYTSLNMDNVPKINNPLPSQTAGNIEAVTRNNGASDIPRLDRNVPYADEDDFVDELESVVKASRPQDNVNIRSTEPAPSGMKQRGYANSLQNKTDLPEEVKAEFDDDYYKVLSNAETSAKADANYVPDDTIKSMSNFNRLLKDKDPSAIPLGYKVANDLISTGIDSNRDMAVDILRQMSEELTRSGQFSQAAAITLMKSDPMTAMRYIQRDIDALNSAGASKYHGKWNDLALTKAEQDAFLTIDPGDTEAISNLYDSIKGRLSKEIPSTLWEKIVSVEKTSMLLNPLTHIKNVAANVALMPVRSATDRVSALGQNIVKIFNPDAKVTQSLTGGSRAQKKIASDYFESIKDSVLGNNKMSDNLKSDVMSNKQIFKDTAFGKWVNDVTGGGIEKLNEKFGKDVKGNVYETVANLNMWLMGEVEDNPFVKQNFVNRLASYMNAQGITNADDIPEEAVSLAIEEAMKATFKDDNGFTNALSSIKKNTGKFGEVLLPFTKTPANLAMRALDYSPVGIASSIKNFRKTGDVSKFIDDLSKNAVGTAGILIGYKLAESGIINGAFSDDYKMANYQKANGEQEYAINANKLADELGVENPDILNGKSITYDWAQPASIPLIIGTTIYDAVQKSDKENLDALDVLNATKDVAVASADRWMELSPLQSLKEAFTGDGFGNDSFGENILSTVEDFPGRFIPSVVGATARTMDDTIRDTYNRADSLDSWKNSMKAKLPGLSESLPVSYDIWGRERTRSNSTSERVLEQFVSPGKIGNENAVDIDGELNRLSEVSGEPITSLVPGSAKRYITLDGAQKDLTNAEHSQYQQMKGSLSYEFAKAITSSNMSDEQKVEALEKSYSFADRIAKEKLFGFSTTSDKKLKEAYDKQGTKGLLNYFVSKGKADELGVKETDDFKKALANGTEQQYAREYNAITKTSYGKDKNGKDLFLSYDDKNRQIYQDKGEQGIKTYANMRKSLPDKYGNADVMKALNSANLSDSDKAYYFMQLKKGTMAKVPSLMDNVEDQYAWYYIKSLIEYSDGKQNISNADKRLLPSLQDNGISQEYIQRAINEKWY